MLSLKNRTLMVVAPHPDDEVLGCGGLISKIKSDGGKVYVLYLTVGATKDFTKKGVSTEKERINEIKKTSELLKYNGWRIAFSGNKHHLKLDSIPQKEIISEIERGKEISLESVKPDIIAFPFYGDYNQDHRAAVQASFTSCRPAPKSNKFVPDIILSYEEASDPWSLEAFGKINFFVELTENQIAEKIKALNLYESQVRGKGHPRSVEAIKSLSIIRGSTAGTLFAEGYYCHKFKL